MKKVITYGTFDMLHRGHVELLKRAKKLGDHLVVSITSEEYDKNRGKLNVLQPLHQRIKNVEKTKLADEIFVEEYDGQKIIDIQKYGIDVFAIGSDWIGKFDYLNEYCKVEYLPRTKGISSTKLRNEAGFTKLGMIGMGKIATRFLRESKYVSNTEVVSAYSRDFNQAKKYARDNEIKYARETFEDLLEDVDAVYIATPHDSHYKYAKECLNNGKHVLCEKPMTLSLSQTKELLEIAKSKNLVLMEAVKTAFCDGFSKLVSFAKSGIIGDIIQVDATFTKIISNKESREYKKPGGGAHNELMSYPLIAASKILGQEVINYKNTRFYNNTEVDIFSKLELEYKHATANLNTGIGAKKEGDLVVTGTKGYIYCPAPWWLTKEFEVRFEDSRKNEKFTYKFQGDGLRYEIAEFVSCINSGDRFSFKLSERDILFLSKFIECEDLYLEKKECN